MAKTGYQELHVYLKPKIHEQFKLLADKNHRSMNSEVLVAIENHMRREAAAHYRQMEIESGERKDG